MARTRMIKPGFFTDENVVSCDPLARLLFQGLWCEADCNGRLEDKPVQLKMRLLPMDNCSVEALLNSLEQKNLISRYVVKGQELIQIMGFLKHQNPHLKERKAGGKYPENPALATLQDGTSRADTDPDPDTDPDTDTSDPLEPYPILKAGIPDIRGWMKQASAKPHPIDIKAKETLAELVRIDKFGEQTILNVLKWVFTEEPQGEGFTCRGQIRSIAGIRRKWKNKVSAFENCFQHWEESKKTYAKPKTQAETEAARNTRNADVVNKIANWQDITLKDWLFIGQTEESYKEYQAQRKDPHLRVDVGKLTKGIK